MKLVDKEILLAQRQEKNSKMEAQRKKKLERQRQEEAQQAAKLARTHVRPSEMFQTVEYIEWDEQGIPTKTREGEMLSKSRRKRLEKEYANQCKIFRG